jgi:hypothetical protein
MGCLFVSGENDLEILISKLFKDIFSGKRFLYVAWEADGAEMKWLAPVADIVVELIGYEPELGPYHNDDAMCYFKTDADLMMLKLSADIIRERMRHVF